MDTSDVQQLVPMFERSTEVTGKPPEKLIANSGCWSEANVPTADDQTELFVANTKDWKRRKELREKDPARERFARPYGPKELMERRLRTKPGREIYRKRSTSVDPVFGQHVNRGLDGFLLRGENGTKAEWSRFSSTHNLSKLWRSSWEPDHPRLPERSYT